MYYQICAGCVKQENMNNNMNIMNNNNNDMEKWVVNAMYQKPCLLFPMQLILFG